jgi:hypothetical protein
LCQLRFSSRASALTDLQCLGMQRHWGWCLENDRLRITMPHPPAGFYGNRHHLRFWATLSRPQRQALLAGAALPLSRLAAAQRQACLRAALAPSDSPDILARDLGTNQPPTAGQLAAARVSVRAAVNHWQEYVGRNASGQSVGVAHSGSGPTPEGGLKFPGLEEVELKPQGPLVVRDTYLFTYTWGGDEKPARQAEIDVPRAQRR